MPTNVKKYWIGTMEQHYQKLINYENTRRDLNSRPNHPKRFALPAELLVQNIFIFLYFYKFVVVTMLQIINYKFRLRI